MDSRLTKELLHGGLDGGFRDPEALGDLFVYQSLQDVPQDLPLPLGEGARRLLLGAPQSGYQ
jgi:hypothetical protein